MLVRRKNCWCLEIILLFSVISLNVSAVRINEVMPHTNNSYEDEWVEIYNLENFTLVLENWEIGDENSNDTINMNISSNGFGIIADSSIGCSNFSVPNESCVELASIGSGLNDDGDTIYLYNATSIVDSFSWNISIKSSGKSWQFCDNGWGEAEPSVEQNNSCQLQQDNTEQNQSQQNQTQQNESEPEIYLGLKHDKEIKNGKKFEVEIKAYNLKNEKYDIKIFIASNNESAISEIYNEEEKKWHSSKYYVKNIFQGPDNKSEVIELRIKEKYEDFYGDAKIKARIRENNKENYITEFEDDIIILIKQKSQEKNETIQEQEEEKENQTIIKLNAIKETEETGKVYKSKTRYIKEYAIYGFALFCVLVIILLIIKRF